MVGVLFRAAYWCVVVALWFIGARLTLGSANLSLREVAVPWLQWIALPLFFLTAAAVMTTIPITKWWLDRKYARDLQRHVRQNLAPGSFAETDVLEALLYLLKESDWGWRQYARLNSWEMVDGLHLKEFRRAAFAGDLLVTGFSSRDGKTVLIERRLWNGLEIDPATLEARIPRSAPYLDKPTFSELAVAKADLKQVWPPASYPLRTWARLWVWAKKTFWYGSRLSNWRDKRRRLSKPERRSM